MRGLRRTALRFRFTVDILWINEVNYDVSVERMDYVGGRGVLDFIERCSGASGGFGQDIGHYAPRC